MTEKISLSCTDMGIAWCEAVLYANSEDELIDEAVRHGKEHWGVSEEMIRSPEFLFHIRDKMRVRE